MKPKPKKLLKKKEEIKNNKSMMTDLNGATKNKSIIPTGDKPGRKK